MLVPVVLLPVRRTSVRLSREITTSGMVVFAARTTSSGGELPSAGCDQIELVSPAANRDSAKKIRLPSGDHSGFKWLTPLSEARRMAVAGAPATPTLKTQMSAEPDSVSPIATATRLPSDENR